MAMDPLLEPAVHARDRPREQGAQAAEARLVNASLNPSKDKEKDKEKAKKRAAAPAPADGDAPPRRPPVGVAHGSVFTVSPDVITLEPWQSCIFVVRGMCAAAGDVDEVLELTASIGNAKGGKPIFSTAVSATFVDPLIEFTEPDGLSASSTCTRTARRRGGTAAAEGGAQERRDAPAHAVAQVRAAVRGQHARGGAGARRRGRGHRLVQPGLLRRPPERLARRQARHRVQEHPATRRVEAGRRVQLPERRVRHGARRLRVRAQRHAEAAGGDDHEHREGARPVFVVVRGGGHRRRRRLFRLRHPADPRRPRPRRLRQGAPPVQGRRQRQGARARSAR